MRTVSTRLFSSSRLGAAALGAALGASASGAATAEILRKGAWPDVEPKVTVEVSNEPRNEALKRVAQAAGWSLVLNVPPGSAVDLHVQDQPADRVLELLLADGSYVATRDGDLIAIAPAPAAPAPEKPAQASAPAPAASPDDAEDERAEEAPPSSRGRDRFVTGGSLRIEKGEVVNDVSVIGGSLDVWGTVTGDIDVMGGSTNIHEGARVRGDVSTVGGPLTVADGATIDGDVDVVGGPLRRGERARIRGDVNNDASPAGGDGSIAKGASALARKAGNAVTRTAFLFAFGAVMLALWPRRMEALKVEIAARPMRSFALGVVGVLGAVAVAAALCVTLIGIPFAVIGLLLAVIAVVAGGCAVLETAGAGLFGHRTSNPYAHLAIGCLGLLIVGGIPYVGGALCAAVALIGAGALVATRLAGLLRPKPRGEGAAGPYRTSP
ncbi:polymer-forming cytoskeletal protein [Sorangium sp. So ce134]